MTQGGIKPTRPRLRSGIGEKEPVVTSWATLVIRSIKKYHQHRAFMTNAREIINQKDIQSCRVSRINALFINITIIGFVTMIER